MKILIVYHGDECIDGFTSAWLATVAAKQAGYEVPELYPLDYEEGTEQALNQHIASQFIMQKMHYDVIYILDTSLSMKALKTLTKTTIAQIIIIDHHKTTFDRYIPDVARTKDEKIHKSYFLGRVQIYLNNGMSGAGMTHKYFWASLEMPLLIQHVQDRDIWKYEMKHTRAVDRYLRQQDQTIENWTDINAKMCHDSEYKEIIDCGYYLLKNYKAEIIDIAHTSEWITIDGAKGLMVKCEYKYASDVGHELCKESGTFGLTYCNLDEGMIKVSLRSKGNYDVEVMAKKLGGGGHKNAAGFIIDSYEFFSGVLT